jgi:glycosyltransferase involved in cell wall biosynthesis
VIIFTLKQCYEFSIETYPYLNILFCGDNVDIGKTDEITSFQDLNHLKDLERYKQTNRNSLNVNRVFKEDYNYSMKHVTFLLPAYNEERSIGAMLEQVSEYPESKVIVVDNNSDDKTAEIAKKRGAIVLQEYKQGKAHAIKKGFEHIKSNFVVMLDADNTYDPQDAKKLLKPLMEDKADVVLGSRILGKREKGSISLFNLFGNYLLSFFASLLFSNVSDVCTGYWAFKKNVIEQFLNEGINSDGFDLEVEMFSKISKNKFRVKEIPILYKKRSDSPKLNSVNDGSKILKKMLIYWLTGLKKKEI